ncbi:phosphoribosylaminoimidazole synthetase [Salipaludibacillus sp. LMS25]|jgi:hypothetical protein|uniref:phosphoribosylaminoimidazole synthetase n=1 Tax=Salipaludibacillus sp. LMS25 TaxID=2924031 RepID=UPI0020D097FE|nr:phosphoribosylaminoimidazole synthetase [Salipaludibacillus sp. LMS25]UTR15006.1 phosphoribosylaminoimidazole synthetase [Salipaludibacillus sp. LMS25]
MKVRCLSNNGRGLTKKALSIGNSIETQYSLENDKIYTVYGINVWDEVMHYLVLGKDENFPSWYPAELFEVVENVLPYEWYFNYYGEDSVTGVLAIWGYKELVLDTNHYIELIEREKNELNIFLKRKQEIDEFLEY